MLLQFKVYLISVLYLFGIIFMILFPPRNFKQSGAKQRSMRSVSSSMKLPQYVDYDGLVATIKHLAANNPDIMQMVRLLPLTAQNRSIVAVELRSDQLSRKPGILIIGALNGMAWGVPTALLELTDKLLYDANYQTPFFNDYDWYLIPMANPDGLQFTQGIRSLPPLVTSEWSRNLSARERTRPAEWHKNLEPGRDHCFGTNINRNFAYHWQDDVHKSPDHCSQFYPGYKPFSSAEAQAIREYVDRLGETIQLAIHLHASYVPKKEFILYPWRYSLRQPSNYRTLQEIGEYAARQARLPDGRLYEVHQGSSDVRVAGSLSDYMAGVVGIDLVYIIKPYHPMFPNYTDTSSLETYVRKALSATLSVVRGWRSSTRQNTLSFFGRDVEF